MQHMKWGHDLCIYSLLGKGFAGLLWTKVAIFYTVLIFSYLGSCASMGPYETILATGGSLNGTQSRRSVDKILQDYAFRVFRHPRTGLIYDATVPGNLSGITVDAIRLRSGSLRRRGVLYNEFDIPKGIVVSPYVKRLVLVYQNFMNLSSIYYDSPGYKLVAPIFGLLAYDASNLNASNLQELDIVATQNPILVRFRIMSSTRGLNPLCIFFSLDGTVRISNVSSPNVCSTKQQGHFSLVVQSLSPTPSPAPRKPPSQGPPPGFGNPPTTISPPNSAPKPPSKPSSQKTSNSWKIAVGSSIGGVAAFVLASFLCFGLLKYRERSHIEHMEHQSEEAEALQTSIVGGTRAPIAGGTRTQPTLENEYIA